MGIKVKHNKSFDLITKNAHYSVTENCVFIFTHIILMDIRLFHV